MATRVKEKAAARKAGADKRPHASVKYVRVAPRKVKIVVDLIRGKQVDQALAILQFTPKAAAPVVEKLLNSAAGAEIFCDCIYQYCSIILINCPNLKKKEKKYLSTKIIWESSAAINFQQV